VPPSTTDPVDIPLRTDVPEGSPAESAPEDTPPDVVGTEDAAGDGADPVPTSASTPAASRRADEGG